MAGWKIVLLGEVRYAHEAFKKLSKQFEVIQAEESSRAAFLEQCGPKGLYANTRVLLMMGPRSSLAPFDQEFAEGLPSNLKFICSGGAGVDYLSAALPFLTKRGVQVSNTPGSVDDSTSTTAVYLMLSCLRQFCAGEHNLREGYWKTGERSLAPAHDPAGKSLGIVGLGGIGKQIARKALAFGIGRVLYHNRHRLDDEEVMPGVSAIYCATLDSLLEQSDIVSLSLPLNDSTRNLISRREFGKMRKGAILINIARGPIVDEEALLEALDSGHLGSVGLDVFPDEPVVNPKLRSNPKLALTPHMGTWTVEALHAMEEQTLRNAEAGLETGKVIDLVDAQRGKV